MLKVIDPFLGSGTTAVVSEQLKRRWMGCDISLEYCQWAAKRIELVENWPVEKWIQYDQENEKRCQHLSQYQLTSFAECHWRV
jgi:site-specific DNA-methyltransferase (adenine-specific)